MRENERLEMKKLYFLPLVLVVLPKTTAEVFVDLCRIEIRDVNYGYLKLPLHLNCDSAQAVEPSSLEFEVK